MLKWFHALMPREDRFFPLFNRHAATIVLGDNARIRAIARRVGTARVLVRPMGPCFRLSKRMARGFRSFRNFRLMALLKAGRLQLHLPSLSPT